jgi:hypothetical protein
LHTPPKALSVDPDRIPPELKERLRWFCWNWVYRPGKAGEEGKWTKPPINPRTGQFAKPNDPATAGTFDRAYQWMCTKHLPGVGVLLTADDPYVVIDLDDVITDSGITPWAQNLLQLFDTYNEPSPSGTGLHLILKCRELPQGRNNKDGIEVYWQDRYFTVTGHPLPGFDVIKDCTDIFLPWHAALSAEPMNQAPGPEPNPSPHASPTSAALTAEDRGVIAACRKLSPEKFFALYDQGDTSGYGDDDSLADAALVGLIAKAGVSDPEVVDRIFRSSKLMRPKWEREDYRRPTIAFALNTVVPGKLTLTKEEQLQREVERLQRQLANEEAEKQSNGEVLQLLSGIRRNRKLRNTGRVAEVLTLAFLSFEGRGEKPPYQLSMTKVAEAAGLSYGTGRKHIRKLELEGLLSLEIIQVPNLVDEETGEILTVRAETYQTPVGSARDFARAVAALDLRSGWGGKRSGAFGRAETPETQPVEASEAQSRIFLGKVISRRGGFPSPDSLYGDRPSATPAA